MVDVYRPISRKLRWSRGDLSLALGAREAKSHPALVQKFNSSNCHCAQRIASADVQALHEIKIIGKTTTEESVPPHAEDRIISSEEMAASDAREDASDQQQNLTNSLILACC